MQDTAAHRIGAPQYLHNVFNNRIRRMNVGNGRKAAQLGMPISTASHRLKKVILFSLVRELGEDQCYHCGQRIEDVDHLSIEHKIGWLYRDAELFWDKSNIAFSHLRCNTTNRVTPQYDRGSDIEQRKAEYLGMPHATAMARLRVRVMHELLARLGCDTCYRCGERIIEPKHLSIEHKVAWLDNDPKLFWDLNNITFSHRHCNSRAASRVRQGQTNGGRYRKVGPANMAWCGRCRAFLPLAQFNRNRSRWNGVNSWCRACTQERRQAGRARTILPTTP